MPISGICRIKSAPRRAKLCRHDEIETLPPRRGGTGERGADRVGDGAHLSGRGSGTDFTDFTDCPAIPAGADPAQWRCEVLMSTGTTAFGTIAEQSIGAMRLTFAEGRLNGEYAQVFGALRAEPVRVPGGLLGTDDHNPLLRMNIRLEYAGYANFLSDGDQMGEQHLKIRVLSNLLPPTCTIGSDQDPIAFKPIRTSGPDVISTNPPVLRFTIEDKTFATPQAHGCGGLTRLVNKRSGVPAPTGTNAMTLTTTVGLRGYTQI